MPTILLDENLEGYAEYLSRFVLSLAWVEISSFLGVRVITFEDIGLAKGTPDEEIWELCQAQNLYLLTDNRNDDKPDSLEATIRARNQPTSLPVLTISNIDSFRSERDYAHEFY